MTFREKNAKYFEPAAQWTMILGVIFLCQPWVEPLHRYGLTTILVGLIGFLITSHVPPPPAAEEVEEEELV